MNNLKILGTVSPYCKDDKNCPGYLIETNKSKILLDCGHGSSGNLNFPNDLKNLNIIISHYHKDHYADLFAIKYAALCYNKQGIKCKVKVYIPKTNGDSNEFIDYKLIKNSKTDYFDIIEYNLSSIIKINDISISFFKTHHFIDCYSTKLECKNKKIVYSADMGFKDIDKYAKFCKNADLFICESTYLESDNIKSDGHLNTKEACIIAKKSNVKKLILTHFWPENDIAKYLNEAKAYFDSVDVAVENKIYI